MHTSLFSKYTLPKFSLLNKDTNISTKICVKMVVARCEALVQILRTIL